MKVLIWILIFVIGSALNTLLGYATGIKAGAVLLYIAEFYIAKKLCEKWDDHKTLQQAKKNKNCNNNAMSEQATSDAKPFNIQEERNQYQAENTSRLDYYDKEVTTDNDGQAEDEERGLVCSNCGMKIPEDSEFCQYCGAQYSVQVEENYQVEECIPKEQGKILGEQVTKFSDVSKFPNPMETTDSKEQNIIPARKRHSKKWVSIAICMCVALICLVGLNVYQYIDSKSKMAELSVTVSKLNATLNEKNELSKTVDELDSTIDELSTQIENKNSEISNLEEQISLLEDDADRYEIIVDAVKYGDLGYAASNFHSNESIIVVGKYELTRKFTLTAYWSNGGTVSVDYDSYFPAAYVDFDQDTWTTSTTMTIQPDYSGVTVVTFSNDVNSQTFDVIIIVE